MIPDLGNTAMHQHGYIYNELNHCVVRSFKVGGQVQHKSGQT